MRRLKKNVDRAIFRNTARRTRKLNVMKFIPRGGIRL